MVLQHHRSIHLRVINLMRRMFARRDQQRSCLEGIAQRESIVDHDLTTNYAKLIRYDDSKKLSN